MVNQQCAHITGNSWGVDPDTSVGCLGCGRQEQFYGCADVRITPAKDWTVSTLENQETTTEVPTTAPRSQSLLSTIMSNSGDVAEASSADIVFTSTSSLSTTDHPKFDENCRAVPKWIGGNILNRWCAVNCQIGFCPSFLCVCTG